MNSSIYRAFTISKTASRSWIHTLGHCGVHLRECHIFPMNCPFQYHIQLPRIHVDYSVTKISMLRDPVDRLFSEYEFSRKLTMQRNPRSRIEFANHSYRHNWQVAVLSGLRWSSAVNKRFLDVDGVHLNELLLLHTKEKLLLGVFEYFDASVQYITKKMGLLHGDPPSGSRRHRHLTRISSKRWMVPKVTRDEIRKHHRLDVLLREAAIKRLFDKT